MARRPELEEIAKEYDLPYFTISELQEYCRSFASSRSEFVNLPTDYGDFEIKDYGNGNLVIKKGEIAKNETVMLRIHSKCLTGDVFGSKRCDCGHQLHQAMRRIEEKGSGLILYLNQEGRGIGLTNKLRAYALQDQGHDTYDANLLLGFAPDERKYDVAAKMIKDLGIKQVQLLTNNPDKIKQLEEAGVEITDRLPLEMAATAEDRRYLETKRDRFKNMLVSL